MSDHLDENADAREESSEMFNELYRSTPPWEIGHPQPAFARVAESGALVGRVLDAGCGTGEHALMAAALGLDVVGLDFAPLAIERATAKASERGLQARFIVWDALRLPELGERFDTVLDCGLFHTFDDDLRSRYVASLAATMTAGGRYFMLCFSDRQPGDWGPRRVSRDEIHESFAAGWRVESIDPIVIEVTIEPFGVHGWMSAIVRDL